MKKILIVYIQMIVGGSTTSLLNLLHEIDYSECSVDLQLFKNEGDLLDKLPSEVNLLPPAYHRHSRIMELLCKFLYPPALYGFLRGNFMAWRYHNPMLKNQLMWSALAAMANAPQQDYDTAIAFLEGWPIHYVAKRIKAKNKIGWIHVDYTKARLMPQYDIGVLSYFDKIVTVADNCMKNLQQSMPSLKDKIISIENIFSRNSIEKMSELPVNDFCKDDNFIQMITVCRLDCYTKGLDRAIMALKQSGRRDIKWYIVGDGPDKEILNGLIRQEQLDKQIFLLGNRLNPFPYVKQADVFFLPSRYEGKPMSVMEALLLGTPAVVSAYSSASEQVLHNKNGFIAENSNTGILQCLKNITTADIENWRRYLKECPVQIESAEIIINRILEQS